MLLLVLRNNLVCLDYLSFKSLSLTVEILILLKFQHK